LEGGTPEAPRLETQEAKKTESIRRGFMDFRLNQKATGLTASAHGYDDFGS